MSADSKQPPFVMERFGRLGEMDRSFDIAYWQKLGSKAIFAEAWADGGGGASPQGRHPG